MITKFNYMKSEIEKLHENQNSIISFKIDAYENDASFLKTTHRFTVNKKSWNKIKKILINENK